MRDFFNEGLGTPGLHSRQNDFPLTIGEAQPTLSGKPPVLGVQLGTHKAGQGVELVG